MACGLVGVTDNFATTSIVSTTRAMAMVSSTNKPSPVQVAGSPGSLEDEQPRSDHGDRLTRP